MQINTIGVLKDKVRWAKEPNNPALILRWLSADACCKSVCSQYCRCSKEKRWQHIEFQFRLLLDVIMDDLLPSEWRSHCLDAIYRPLSELYQLANSEDDKGRIYRLEYELAVSSRYVSHTLCGAN